MRPTNRLLNERQPRIGVGFARLPLYMRRRRMLGDDVGDGGEGGGAGGGDGGGAGAGDGGGFAPDLGLPPGVSAGDTSLPVDTSQPTPPAPGPNDIVAQSPDGQVVQFGDGSVMDFGSGLMSDSSGNITGSSDHGPVIGMAPDGTIMFADGATYNPSTQQFSQSVAAGVSAPAGKPASGGGAPSLSPPPKSSPPSSTPAGGSCPAPTIRNPLTGQCWVPIPAAKTTVPALQAASILQQAPLGIKNEYLLLGFLGLVVIPPLLRGRR